MEHLFSTALTIRQFLVTKLEKLDNEQLDTIPEGFNNNIRWNIAHLIVTPHLLTYNMVGQKNSLLSDDFINSAKKGSNPDSFSMNEDFGIKHLSETLIEVIKKLLFPCLSFKTFSIVYLNPSSFVNTKPERNIDSSGTLIFSLSLSSSSNILVYTLIDYSCHYTYTV